MLRLITALLLLTSVAVADEGFVYLGQPGSDSTVTKLDACKAGEYVSKVGNIVRKSPSPTAEQVTRTRTGEKMKVSDVVDSFGYCWGKISR